MPQNDGDDKLIEELAELIYRNDCGPDCDENGELFDPLFERRQWKTDAPWDTRDDELREWERDEYRETAKAVIKFLREQGELK